MLRGALSMGGQEQCGDAEAEVAREDAGSGILCLRQKDLAFKMSSK